MAYIYIYTYLLIYLLITFYSYVLMLVCLLFNKCNVRAHWKNLSRWVTFEKERRAGGQVGGQAGSVLFLCADTPFHSTCCKLNATTAKQQMEVDIPTTKLCMQLYFISQLYILFGGSGSGVSSHVDDIILLITVSHLPQYVTNFTVCTNTNNLPIFQNAHSLAHGNKEGNRRRYAIIRVHVQETGRTSKHGQGLPNPTIFWCGLM